MIVAGGVEDEFTKGLSGGGVDDADVVVVDQRQDLGSGLGLADTDVVESSGDSEGDVADLGDPVGADPVVAVVLAATGGGFGSGLVGGGGGCLMGQGPVRSVLVVGLDEGVEQGLEFSYPACFRAFSGVDASLARDSATRQLSQ